MTEEDIKRGPGRPRKITPKLEAKVERWRLAGYRWEDCAVLAGVALSALVDHFQNRAKANAEHQKAS